ncbi:MAG TPA: twin-arginine translocase subunit TatC [Kofleriaceae bacterium]|jgi:sec-independent protein translocase protein TatC
MASAARKRVPHEELLEEAPKNAADLEGSRMPFLAHLVELKGRVTKAAFFFLGAFGVCFYFAQDIFTFLKQPLWDVWPKDMGPPNVVFGSLTEPFWVEMSLALWAGVFLASPFIFYQLWKFIAPGLYKKERRLATLFAVCSAILFIAGALFCYQFVLHSLYKFLVSYGTADTKPMILMESYLDLTRDMMLAFGAVFELPLLIFFLAIVGLVTHRSLWKFNRWFIVIAFVVGAILTPSPDVVSQIMMATPMIVLYNLSIIGAWRVTLKRERKAAAQAAIDRIREEEEEAARQVRKAKKRAAKAAKAKAEAEAAAAAEPKQLPDKTED